jgi:hypothetical protein
MGQFIAARVGRWGITVLVALTVGAVAAVAAALFFGQAWFTGTLAVSLTLVTLTAALHVQRTGRGRRYAARWLAVSLLGTSVLYGSGVLGERGELVLVALAAALVVTALGGAAAGCRALPTGPVLEDVAASRDRRQRH